MFNIASGILLVLAVLATLIALPAAGIFICRICGSGMTSKQIAEIEARKIRHESDNRELAKYVR